MKKQSKEGDVTPPGGSMESSLIDGVRESSRVDVFLQSEIERFQEELKGKDEFMRQESVRLQGESFERGNRTEELERELKRLKQNALLSIEAVKKEAEKDVDDEVNRDAQKVNMLDEANKLKTTETLLQQKALLLKMSIVSSIKHNLVLIT